MRILLTVALMACAPGCADPGRRNVDAAAPDDGAEGGPGDEPAGEDGEGGGGGPTDAGGDEGEGEGGGPPPGCSRPEHCDRGEACDRGDCVPVECVAATDCDPGVACVHGLCLNLGRACDSAADRPLWVGVTAEGDRDAGGSNLDAECAGTGLVPESILQWEVRQRGDGGDGEQLVLTVETDGFVPVVSVLSDCGDGAAAPTTVLCETLAGPRGRILMPALDPGVYYVVIDGLDDEAPANRHFRATVAALPAADTPGGERCEDAVPIVFDEAERRGQISGDLIAAADDGTACGAGDGQGDLTWSIELEDDAGLSVSVRSTDPRTAWAIEPAGCDPRPAPLACRDAPGSVAFGRLPAGRYHLVIDGPADFLADVVLHDPPPVPSNDGCGAPQRVRLGVDGEAVVPGDTSVARDGGDAACGAPDAGPDLVYSVELPAGRRMRALVRPGGGWPATLSIRGTCGGAEPDLLCAPGGQDLEMPAAAQDRLLHLIVGAENGVGGPFDLVVQSLPPAAGDTCDDPLLLVPAGEGLFRAQGSTVGQADSFQVPCNVDGGDDTGADVFVRFDAPEAGSWFVGLQAAFDATLTALSGACADGEALECNDDAAEPGLASALTLRDLPAGTWFLVVDGFGPGAEGPFTLTVERLDPPANDRCADAAPLALDPVSRTARVAGSLRVAADDGDASCAEEGWGEVWYTVDLAQRSSLRLRTAPEGGLAATAVGALDRGCAREELGCGVVRPGQGSLFLPDVGPGAVPIFVEGGGTATFELVVQAGPPAAPPDNEECGSAEPLAFVDDAAVVSGQLLRAADDHPAVCGGAGPDAAYVFDLDAPRQLRVARTPGVGDADLHVSLYGAGCAEHLAMSCVTLTPDAAAPARIAGGLGPGRFWLVVEAGQGGDLGYELTWTLDDPVEVPANDQCAAPGVIEYDVEAEDPDPVEVRGNTELAANDFEAACAAGARSPDVVWRLDLVRPASVTLTMVAEGGWDNALHLRRGDCGAAEAEIGCNDDNPAVGSSILRAPLLAPGDYYVIADGYSDGNAGAFVLTVDVGPEPRCPDAEVIDVPDGDDPAPIVLRGTTLGAEDHMGASCAAGARSPDVLYAFTLDRPRPVSVVMTAAGGWDNALHLRRAPCADAASEVACNDDAPQVGRSALEVGPLAPGEYFLFADGYAAGNAGGYELTVDFGRVPAPPGNDTCEDPALLTDEGGPVAVAAVDLTAAAADADACEEGSVDAFWTLSPQDDGPFAVAVTTTAGMLSTGAECGAADADGACDASLLFPGGVGGPTVWVSGPAGARGDLTALFGPPTVPLDGGDDCDTSMGLPVGRVTFVHGDLDGATDAVQGGVGGCDGRGPDRVFGLFVQRDTRVRVDLVARGFDPVLWARAGACQQGAATACDAPRRRHASLDLALRPGLTTLVVDSQGRDAAGEFMLRVGPADPVPNP